MNFTKRSLRVAAVLVTIAGLAALSACTAATSPPTPSAAHVEGLPEGVRQATNVPTEVPNTPQLRHNVRIDSCTATDGGWKASGSAKNPEKTDTTYTVSVFFTTDHGTVLGAGSTKVGVPAGKTSTWSVTAQLTPAPKTRCVLRGVG